MSKKIEAGIRDNFVELISANLDKIVVMDSIDKMLENIVELLFEAIGDSTYYWPEKVGVIIKAVTAEVGAEDVPMELMCLIEEEFGIDVFNETVRNHFGDLAANLEATATNLHEAQKMDALAKLSQLSFRELNNLVEKYNL